MKTKEEGQSSVASEKKGLDENFHHSIQRPSDIAHLTIRDLDTNEEVIVF